MIDMKLTLSEESALTVIDVGNLVIMLVIAELKIKEIMKSQKLILQGEIEAEGTLNKVNSDKDIKSVNIELGLEIKRPHQKGRDINHLIQVHRQVPVPSLVHIQVQVLKALTESIGINGGHTKK